MTVEKLCYSKNGGDLMQAGWDLHFEWQPMTRAEPVCRTTDSFDPAMTAFPGYDHAERSTRYRYLVLAPIDNSTAAD